MYNKNNVKAGFPDPLASREEKLSEEYGLRYAKAIQDQWGDINQKGSVYGQRNQIFERNRQYATELRTPTFTRDFLLVLMRTQGTVLY